MAVQQPVSWLDIYEKIIGLEAQLQELRQMVSKLKPENGEIVCHHPVKLEGMWAGVEITEDDIAAAKSSLFPYEHDVSGI